LEGVRRTAFLVMTGLALLVVLASLRYFSLNPVVFIPGQRAAYLANLGPLLLHIGAGSVALAVGPLQFLGGLRSRRPMLHKALGRVYLTAVLLTAVGGLALSRIAEGGPMARLGFASMAVVLLVVTAIALAAILRGRVATHRAWMTRSYAVIFSAVTFRLWLGVMVPLGLPFDQAYAVGSWTAWMINLLGAEAVLALGRTRRPVLTAAARQAAHPAPAEG
jgi:uncharacterized membrane protein